MSIPSDYLTDVHEYEHTQQTEKDPTVTPPTGPRRSFDGGSYEEGGANPGETGHQDEGSPIGDAALPLTLMALAFGGFIFLRRRQHA